MPLLVARLSCSVFPQRGAETCEKLACSGGQSGRAEGRENEKTQGISCLGHFKEEGGGEKVGADAARKKPESRDRSKGETKKVQAPLTTTAAHKTPAQGRHKPSLPPGS